MNKHRLLALLILTAAPLLLIIHPLFSNVETELYRLYNAGLTVDAVQYASKITNSRKLSSKGCYVFGSALLDEDLPEQALLWLARSRQKNAPWSERATVKMAKAAAQTGNQAEQLKLYHELIQNNTNSPHTLNKLESAVELALKQDQHNTIITLLNRTGRNRTPGYSLYYAASLFKKNRLQPAFSAFKRALHGNFYNDKNHLLLRLYSGMKQKGLTLSPLEQIKLAEAFIRDNRRAAAQRLLSAVEQNNRTNRRLRFEIGLNRLWMLRRQRNWPGFNRSLQNLFRTAATNRTWRLRLHSHAAYAALRQNHKQTALRHALQAADINKKTGYRLLRKTAGRKPGANLFTYRVACAGIKLFPDYWSFQEMAVYYWLDRYNRRDWQRLYNGVKELIPSLSHHHLRATALWLRWQAAVQLNKPVSIQNKLQTAAVTAEPLGYYHRIIGTPRQPATWNTTNSLQQLCKAWLTTTEPPGKLTALIKQRWSATPLSQITKEKFQPLHIATNMVPDSRRSLFLKLVKQGLYRDAFYEADLHLNLRTRTLAKQNGTALYHLSLLARRSGYHSMEMQCLRALFYKFGWTRELSVIDKLTGSDLYQRLYPRPFKNYVQKYSQQNGLDPLLIWALMRQESGFHPTIKSWAGAYGLMQVMPATGMGLAGRMRIRKVNLRDPETNIKLGCSLLQWLNKTFKGRPEPILIGYNAGAGRVSSWKRRYSRKYGEFHWYGYVEAIPFRETRYYIKKVLSNLSVYQFLYDS